MQNYREESFGDYKAERKPAKQSIDHSTNGKQATPKPTDKKSTHLKAATPAQRQLQPTNSIEEPPTRQLTRSESIIPMISFAKAGRTVSADGRTPILELAEQEGIEIRHACRVGSCGACKILIHEGEVQYDTPPVALSPADQQAGYALACVAYPTKHLKVEV